MFYIKLKDNTIKEMILYGCYKKNRRIEINSKNLDFSICIN